MSWTIEFITWSGSNGGESFHTISDNIIDLKIDADKITGIDYHSQESRNAKITILNDNSDFFQNNIINDISNNIFGYSKIFWDHAVRIKLNDEIKFTGWVKITSIKYNKKTDIIELTASDILSVMLANGEYSTQSGGITHQFRDLLRSLIWNSFNPQYSEFGIDEYGLNVINNYDFQTGISYNGLELTMTNEDWGMDYNNWDDYFGAEINTFWGYGIWYAPHFLHSNPHNILNLRLEDGIPILTLMRYFKCKYNPYQGSHHIKEKLSLATCKFDSNMIPYDFYADTTTTTTTSDNPSQQTINYGAELLYNNDYVNAGHPTINALSLDIDGENTIYFGEYEENPITIKFDGLIGFTEIIFNVGEYSFNARIKMLLMINNLALKVDNLGNIVIINKDYSISDYIIADADVLEFTQSRVLRKSPDYSSVLSPLADNVNIITTALQSYYDDFIPDFEYSVEIVNNYDLNLNDEITVYGKQMIIVEIDKDLDDFSYKIKAWST
jgi:hypothetical protein